MKIVNSCYKIIFMSDLIDQELLDTWCKVITNAFICIRNATEVRMVCFKNQLEVAKLHEINFFFLCSRIQRRYVEYLLTAGQVQTVTFHVMTLLSAVCIRVGLVKKWDLMCSQRALLSSQKYF